jgi:GMP synthase-like glutamine amidotransferase
VDNSDDRTHRACENPVVHRDGGVVLILTHGEHERAELLERGSVARGFAVATVRVDQEAARSGGGQLPDPRDFDAVFVMGADESVYDESVGWIGPEVELVQRAVRADVAVLGVCFGGQLLAYALGGEVAPAAQPELGWLRLESVDERLVPAGPWLSWHGDAFTIPPGARRIAWSDQCEHAFTLGPHVGLQFHPEVTPDLLRVWFDDAERRGHGVGEQRDGLLAEAETQAARSVGRAGALLDEFLRRSGLALRGAPVARGAPAGQAYASDRYFSS